ncbi:MAG: Histidyl-tRNA synthetase [Candidatus Beckwithbacteria bacterium GW2011_GWB1_47_15]|uniref:Histidine--tRNA ligase n=1 Tax=Candidatus Beckwithbacteria bacterium GW2011_GWB1_47_15 TaxID=1618371 RepID=A0A0G1U505_9BACT|nr:MAG: histidyl-tRNA synthetase, histidyl-tRNA synthetase [Candidatus Beckwithbacteria bacterium GW2011_GWC1_49_16]KKU35318.1 MAG: Histidyl-tRNA synthetase [Candidatus Beckwithbacteria bacterium GW2011_GWA1_46_30]KKU61413.1 MAG: Histidyl-tRNA synthetase [Candidatus Beckwithbacteria bacterium GW2011_GWB1_47_15]KKU71820.1 MAG: Histidyl-tRNA synthetase [Candidatus Beckwithbacteria bacterium GW2011_GWA2_47_25]KKW03714.1 MAG: Histidyl-tRNA synthetase [Candidatus Beckwithbacteria bacterium GW2011_GW
MAKLNLPQTLKGFRDFLPNEKRKRDFVLEKIKQTFELFGFEPLETPTLEYADLLLGKYGKEADKLIYIFKDRGNREVGLRYDQTVPTARVLTQYKNQLPKYFRRYQFQNVYRADKPQKGRYREFTQCDIDIFGTTSPLADTEIIACTYFAFKNVGFPNVTLRINDRQILFDVIKKSGITEQKSLSVIQSLDKLDKKTVDQVQMELKKKGVTLEQFQKINNLLKQARPTKQLEKIIGFSISSGVPEDRIEFIPYLARGLDYYTGMIFEVIIPEFESGSLGGGGRYDKLIDQLSGTNTPAVGIAFGFDRMVEAASEMNLIPKATSVIKALITIFPGYEGKSLNLANTLRTADIKTEIFPQDENLDKQLKYAAAKNIPFVLMIGPDEAKADKVTLKDMTTGEQQSLTLDQVVVRLK